jgi:hypothetical protein
MDATVVNTLFALGASICLLLLLWGGWLSLRYGDEIGSYGGSRQRLADSARALACAPAGGRKKSVTGSPAPRTLEPSEEILFH